MPQIPLLPELPFQSAPLRSVAVLHHPLVPVAQELLGVIQDLLRRLDIQGTSASVWETEAAHEALASAEICITLGGDGSMLRASRISAPLGVPVLGINLGKLGFLAEVEPRDVRERLPAILGGNYWIEERMMIIAGLQRDGSLVASQECLNEVVVARRHLSRVVRVQTSIDGHPLTTYTGDGVLVATPTGSTAYSLAAGGPILHPEVRNLVLTPISAHLSLRSPLVLPPTSEVRLQVTTDHEAGASFDGQRDIELRSGDAVVVRSGPNPARFVRAQERAYFYHTLIHKLSINH